MRVPETVWRVLDSRIREDRGWWEGFTHDRTGIFLSRKTDRSKGPENISKLSPERLFPFST